MDKKAKPVQARSQKTRENLLKAALVMYERKGYHKTTVDDIAANILRIEREEEQNIPAPSVSDHKKSSLLSKIGKIFKK